MLTIRKRTRLVAFEALAWGGEYMEAHEQRELDPLDPRVITGGLPSLDARLPLVPPEGFPLLAEGRRKWPMVEPGEYAFGFEFQVPAGAPTTWNGGSTGVPGPRPKVSGGLTESVRFEYVGVRYEVKARAAFGLTGEALANRVFEVEGPLKEPSFAPGARGTPVGQGKVGLLELALDYAQSSPLGLLRGRVRIADSPRRIRGVRVELIEDLAGFVRPERKRPYRRELRTLAHVEIPATSARAMDERFELRVPEFTLESRPGRVARRVHFIEARADVALARDPVVRADVNVLHPSVGLLTAPRKGRKSDARA